MRVTAEELRLVFERFAELGEKHAFRWSDGGDFLGWVLDVRADAVLLAWAPTPFHAQAHGTDVMAPPDAWVPFTAIALDSLAYWDPVAARWVAFAPS